MTWWITAGRDGRHDRLRQARQPQLAQDSAQNSTTCPVACRMFGIAPCGRGTRPQMGEPGYPIGILFPKERNWFIVEPAPTRVHAWWKGLDIAAGVISYAASGECSREA